MRVRGEGDAETFAGGGERDGEFQPFRVAPRADDDDDDARRRVVGGGFEGESRAPASTGDDAADVARVRAEGVRGDGGEVGCGTFGLRGAPSNAGLDDGGRGGTPTVLVGGEDDVGVDASEGDEDVLGVGGGRGEVTHADEKGGGLALAHGLEGEFDAAAARAVAEGVALEGVVLMDHAGAGRALGGGAAHGEVHLIADGGTPTGGGVGAGFHAGLDDGAIAEDVLGTARGRGEKGGSGQIEGSRGKTSGRGCPPTRDPARGPGGEGTHHLSERRAVEFVPERVDHVAAHDARPCSGAERSAGHGATRRPRGRLGNRDEHLGSAVAAKLKFFASRQHCVRRSSTPLDPRAHPAPVEVHPPRDSRGVLSDPVRVRPIEMATDAPKKQRSLSYRLHDALNVPLVGGLSVMCILGLLGLMDAHLITKIFITYITIDALWIIISPSAVPKHAWAIVLHHVLTFAILLHPLRYPEHAIETCRDGIVELNTFFLITRRNLTRGSLLNRLCDVAYHLTLSIRFFWQPYLIYHFRIITHMDSTDRPGGYPFAEHYMVMISQVLLCVFNIMIVLPGLLAKKKKPEEKKA